MRAALRPGGDHRGQHQRGVLASFRPSWPQALAGGLHLGVGCTLALVATTVVGTLLAWPALLVPLPLGMVCGAMRRRRLGTWLDAAGLRTVAAGRHQVAPWWAVTDIRTERRRRLTSVVVYLDGGGTIRLPAPYDGRLLARDRGFERKLFLICHIWETHRGRGMSGDRGVPGAAAGRDAAAPPLA